MSRLWLGAAILALLPSIALAESLSGEWARDDGKAKVRFSPCGGATCGSITWVRDPNDPGKVGQRVFFDLVPAGENAWTGSAFNPEDGKNYTGKVTMSGASLLTKGCVFGGLICKSVAWHRAN